MKFQSNMWVLSSSTSAAQAPEESQIDMIILTPNFQAFSWRPLAVRNRLLHNPSLVVLGLSVGYETLYPIG